MGHVVKASLERLRCGFGQEISVVNKISWNFDLHTWPNRHRGGEDGLAGSVVRRVHCHSESDGSAHDLRHRERQNQMAMNRHKR